MTITKQSMTCLFATVCAFTMALEFDRPAHATPRGPVAGPTYRDGYVINGRSNVVIDGANFTSAKGACLTISNSNGVIIRNSSFIKCWGVGVSIVNSTNVQIVSDYFQDLNGGVYAISSSTIKVLYNNFKNVKKTYADISRGQFVQFNNVRGAGNSVSNNRGINVPGYSDPEDLVSMFQTNGTSTSPVIVANNCFSGGGPSTSGGGIMTGDYGGSYITVQNNTLVNPGQYGIAIASGTNIKLIANRIYGKQQPFTNVGMYVWNITPTVSACGNHVIQNNQVDYTNKSGVKNPVWDAGNCPNTVYSGNNWYASLSTLTCTLY